MNRLSLIILSIYLLANACQNLLARDSSLKTSGAQKKVSLVEISSDGQTAILENGHSKLKFQIDGERVFWRGYLDKAANLDIIDHNGVFLLIRYLSPEPTTLFNHSIWENAEFRQNNNTLVISLRSPDIGTIEVGVELKDKSVYWSMNINQNKDHERIDGITFPAIEAAPLGGDATDDWTFYPQRSGLLIKDVLKTMTSLPRRESHGGALPSGLTSLGLMGMYDRKTGFIMHTEDLNFYPKKLKVTPIKYPDSRQRILFGIDWETPARVPGAPRFPSANVFGTQVTTLLHGDWYDASQIYRTRMRNLAPGRFEKIPSQKLSDISLWISDDCAPGAQCTDKIKGIARRVGHPIGYHWYVWHQIPFDNFYPGFLPPKKGFRSSVSDLQKENVIVMPYINAHLWDTRRKDYNISDALIRSSGEPYYFGKLARMCPTSNRFMETLSSLSNRLFQHYQVDGIYLDQIAAVWPMECHNQAHAHHRDPSNWWTKKGTYVLVDKLKNLPQAGFYTSEWANEAFVGRLDGMLTNYFSLQDQIPLFNAVYNDVVRTFGRFHWNIPNDESAYRMKIGQSLVYGNQLGWLNFATTDGDRHLSQSIGLAKLRQRYLRFFNGTLERPPVIEQTETVSADWNYYWKPTPITLPAVVGGRFADEEANVMSVFVNLGESSVELNCPEIKRYVTNVGEELVVKNAINESFELASGQAAITQRSIDRCSVFSMGELSPAFYQFAAQPKRGVLRH